MQQPNTQQESLVDQAEGSSAQSLTILGTEFGCGKTTLMCGLSALFREQGFIVRARKTIFVGSNSEREAEGAFISNISRTPPNELMVAVERGTSLNNRQWMQAVKAGKPGKEFTLIELPAGLATPLTFDQERESVCWRNATDLAKEYGFPCLIVAKHADDAIEKLTTSTFYAKGKGLKLLGLATVETSPHAGQQLELMFSRDKVELALHSVTGVPYLGCIKYSQSISVSNNNQGNLVKMTAGGIETLNLLKNLNLNLPRTE